MFKRRKPQIFAIAPWAVFLVELLFFLIHFGLETKIGMFWTSCLELSGRTGLMLLWTSTITRTRSSGLAPHMNWRRKTGLSITRIMYTKKDWELRMLDERLQFLGPNLVFRANPTILKSATKWRVYNAFLVYATWRGTNLHPKVSGWLLWRSVEKMEMISPAILTWQILARIFLLVRPQLQWRDPKAGVYRTSQVYTQVKAKL